MIFGTKDKDREMREAMAEAPLWMGWQSRELVIWKHIGFQPDGRAVFDVWGKTERTRRKRRISIYITQMYQSWTKGLLWPAVIQGSKE